MANPLYLRPHSPFRPTDWRWAKARLMREDPRTAAPLRGENDTWTVKAKRFQEEYDRCGTDYDRMVLAQRWPMLTEAHAFRFDDTVRISRFQLEARLLAGEGLEEIAAKLSATVQMVEWYEKLFFNVLDRLGGCDWVTGRVLGGRAQADLDERDFDVVWKQYGWSGGPLVLDALIGGRSGVTRPESSGQVGRFLDDDVRRTDQVKASLAYRTMPVNAGTRRAILGIHQKFKTAEAAAGGGAGGEGALAANISEMVRSVRWTVGDKRVLVAADDPSRIVGRLPQEVVDADAGAVELRADELMQVNTGQRPGRTHAPTRFPEKGDANR